MNTTNLHYKFLKLTNGDDIICTTDNDCSKLRQTDTLSVVDPVILTPVRYPKGTSIVEGYVFRQWIKFVTETVFEIPVSTIIVASDVEARLKDSYIEFLLREKEEEKEVEEIGDSSDEREKIIEMLNSISNLDREDDESSEEEIKRYTPNGHSIH